MRKVTAVLALLTCVGASSMAAPPAGTDAPSRYDQERAKCLTGHSPQTREDCLRDAGAARAEAGRLDNGLSPSIYEHNAKLRCQPLPEADREACLARMSGQGTTSGSVQGGGILREKVTREVGPTPLPDSTPREIPPPTR